MHAIRRVASGSPQALPNPIRMGNQPITRGQAPAHKHDGSRHAHDFTFRDQEITLLGARDEMYIQLDSDIGPVISGFPDRMAKGLIKEGGNHAAMDNAMDIAVLFFHQQPMQAAPINGFLPEGTNQCGEAILMPDKISPAIGGGVIGLLRDHGAGVTETGQG